MTKLSDDGRRALGDIAERYSVSLDAVEHLLMAVIAGQATQAQFNHPDLGGMGQWSQGGMIMVGDMFNNGLKAKVSGMCSELADLVHSSRSLLEPVASHQSQYQGGVSLLVPGAGVAGNWWPDNLGYAASTGAQNDLRYAFFPASHRLAINIGGRVTVYDTKDHQISGFSQQQSGDQSLCFTSQYGLVKISDLDVVPSAEKSPVDVPAVADVAPVTAVQPFAAIQSMQEPQPMPEARAQSDDDIFTKIERLAALHAKGILTDQEFEAKKTELLSRL